MTQFLTFTDVPRAGVKTRNVEIRSVNTPTMRLGRIGWYAPWRQYTFFPEQNTIWNQDCLDAVQRQVWDMNRLHKAARKEKIP